MKGRVIALGTWRDRAAAALIVDGRLEDVFVDPPEDTPPPGTIFRAKAQRPAKGMGGQFVGLEKGLNGFLRQGQIPDGRTALVQVSGLAEPGKAVPVTAKLTYKGRYVIVTPGATGVNVSRQIRDEERGVELKELAQETCPDAKGLIFRSACADAPDDDIAAEMLELHRVSVAIAADAGDPLERLLDGADAHARAANEWHDAEFARFEDFEVGEMLAEMARAKAVLGSATAWIEPTRALVAIDVNTQGDTSPSAGLKANIALAKDLPRQLRCRGLGGQITIDFAPFPKKDRRQLETTLRAALKRDSVETALVGWTPLGHFELNRKRDRWPLGEP